MKKILNLDADFKDGYIVGQRVRDNDNGTLIFSAYDLSECPEDATLFRDLFTADDYIRAIRYGIELAKQGYDGVEFDHDDFKQGN